MTAYGEARQYLYRAVAERPESDDCMIWPYAKNGHGYGILRIAKGKNARVHRLAYEAAFGPMDPSLDGCHRCDNPACFRPEHIFPGSRTVNMRDASKKGRTVRGTRHGSAKLTEDQVRAIRVDPRPQQAIANEYGISQMSVSFIRRRVNWAWLS